MISETVGWVFAYPNELYRTSNGGEQWERVEMSLPERAYLTDINFFSVNAGWVAVSKTQLNFDSSTANGSYEDATWIMETHDGGRTWKEQRSFEGAQISQIRFLNSNDGWAVGRTFAKQAPARDANLVLHTSDGGRSWIDLSRNLPESGVGVSQLYPIDLGKASLLTLNGLVYSTTNGGRVWQQDDIFRNEHPQMSIHRFGLTNEGRLWLVGGTSGLEGMRSIFASRTSRGNWSSYAIEGIDVSDALLLSADQILASGSISSKDTASTRQAVLLYSTNGGKNWVIVYRDARSTSLNSLAAISKQVFAVGERGLVVKFDLP